MPCPCSLQAFKYNDLSWSLWDRWILEGDLTVQQVGGGDCCVGIFGK